MKYLWKIGGEAGFGIMTSGLLFSKIAAKLGYNVFDYVEFPSLVRGGHNAFESFIGDEEVTSLKKQVDCLICLNKDTFELHKNELCQTSLVVFDSTQFIPEGDYVKIDIPFGQIVKDCKGQSVMKNTIALGASLALLGADLTILNGIIEKQFTKKGAEVVNFNVQLAQKGHDMVIEKYKRFVQPILIRKDNKERIVLSGNDAFSFGAVVADCRLYSAYPMTPSSSVLTVLAANQEKTGMVVRHAEDEISVINTALGSAFGGVRSAVGTSGGGFALMVESLSFAGIAEIPIVVFLAQRPGPATGMPSWTEQGDLLFTIHGGHGEFPKIVLAPGDVKEMFKLTLKAFQLADIYQTPVIVMSDMYLSESHKDILKSELDKTISNYTINRGKIVSNFEGKKYLRYQLTDDGISPMLIPGFEGQYYQTNSYEHVEDGHTTEAAKPRIQQVDKRKMKMKTYLSHEFSLPKMYGDAKAQTVFVSWGSTKGSILEAMKILSQKNITTSLLHFTHMYPMDEEKVKAQFDPKKKYILVENNSEGQLGKLLRMETGINIKEKILRYDGRIIWPEDIVEKLLTINH